jgi:hypothetical protein
MTLHDIAQLRLVSQRLLNTPNAAATEVVEWMGAMQAQDYAGAKWSLGMRAPGTTEANIEQAIASGEIIRTWPMRGTLHFVPSKDAAWMLQATTPRIIAMAAGRHRQLGLNDEILQQGAAILVETLASETPVVRKDLLDALQKRGIDTKEQRGYHIIWWAAQHGLLSVGPLHGKQPTFTTLAAPKGVLPTIQQSLRMLAERYFQSHGPATLKDFAWWSGLKIVDARAALSEISDSLDSVVVDGAEYWYRRGLKATSQPSVLLLPGFDEYLLGYTDRSAALAAEHSEKIVPGKNGMFMPTIVVDGRVVGTWKRTITAQSVRIKCTSFAPLSTNRHAELVHAAQRYGAYLGLSVDLQQ